jgi:hypothetical protein
MDDTKLRDPDADHPAAHLTPTAEPTPLPLSTGAPSLPSPSDPEEINDHDDSDRDSAYGESLPSSDTASITSDITKYRYENGRRYHAYRDGAYWAPNDEIHNDQQDMAHHLWLLTLDNKLYLAPILNPQVSWIHSPPSLIEELFLTIELN